MACVHLGTRWQGVLQHRGLHGPQQARLFNPDRPPRVRGWVPAFASAAPAVSLPTPAPSKQPGLVTAWRAWWDMGVDMPGPQLPLRRTLGWLAGLVREDSLLLGVAVVAMLTAAMADLAIPHCIAAGVFAASQQRSRAALSASLTRLAAAAGLYACTAAVRGYLFSLLNLNLLQRLRSRAFAAMLSQPVAWFDATDGGELASRLGSDCASVSKMVATSVNVALRNGIQCVGAAVYLFCLHPGVAGAACACGAGLAFAAAAYGDFCRRSQRAYQDGLASAAARAEEAFSLSRVVRSLGAEAGTAARYDAGLARLAWVAARQAVAYTAWVLTSHGGYNAMRAAALAVGGAAAVTGVVSPQQLTAFMLYAELLASATLGLAEQYGPIMEALGASERVIAYLGMPPAPQLGSGVVPEHVQGEIEFRGVSFSYPTRPGQLALDRASLVIPPGKTTALVGSSGSGKSTLVALLQRLYDPSVGSVRLDGRDLRDLDAAWFRRQLGVVSQDPRLFSMTIAENIAYGWPEATRVQVERAAELANAAGFIAALPQGYDTPVTDRLLSGGQRQRIAIARALVRDPAILILDEATSALDAESEAAVNAALDRVIRSTGRTVIVIAHRLSTVANAHLTVVMAGGRIAERGSHAELMLRGGLYASLVARQSGKTADQRDLAPHEAQPEPSVSKSDALASTDVGGSTSGDSTPEPALAGAGRDGGRSVDDCRT